MIGQYSDWRWLLFIVIVIAFGLLRWDVSYVNSIGIFLLLSGHRDICQWIDKQGNRLR